MLGSVVLCGGVFSKMKICYGSPNPQQMVEF